MNSLIVGAPGVGKSTLIRKVLAELHRPVFGYESKKETDTLHLLLGHPIYIYEAGKEKLRSPENLIGYCKDRKPTVYKEAFDRFVPKLLKPIPEGAVILLDEIGFMETVSEPFCRAILSLLDGDHPVLAAVKDKDIPFLRAIRSHPKATCFHLTQDNRNSLLPLILQQLQANL